VFINGLILKQRAKQYIAQQPELRRGYDSYWKGWLSYGSIPWVIMMIGDVSGQTESIFDYFQPSAMNPIVLLFHASIIVLWALAIRWIYFKNGAEFFEAHPGLIRKSSLNGTSNVTAQQVKLFFPVMLLGGIAGMIMMWIVDFPTPQF
jgi:hypothetical protein